jgi:hypothetical protein
MFDRDMSIDTGDQVLLLEINLLENVLSQNNWGTDMVLYKVLHLPTNRTAYLRVATEIPSAVIDDKFFRAAHIFSIEFKALEDVQGQRG